MYDTFMISRYSRNGGGAFLIPFFFFLITSGGPLYYLEVCLGQFTGRGAGHAFEFCPLLKGLQTVFISGWRLCTCLPQFYFHPLFAIFITCKCYSSYSLVE